jgi:diguanylate cyclase (GGDEF)-like protein/PAS domain S-box-containing protein
METTLPPTATENTRAPIWLNRLYTLAILLALVMTGIVGAEYYVDRHIESAIVCGALAGFVAVLTLSSYVIRRGNYHFGSFLLQSSVFACLLVLSRYSTNVNYTLALIPIISIALSLLYFHRQRPSFLFFFIWLFALIGLLFADSLGYVSHNHAWLLIATVGAIGNAVGLAMGLAWRYESNIEQLGAAASETRNLQNLRTKLEKQVAEGVDEIKQRESRFRAVSELTSDYAFGWQIDKNGNLFSEWATDAIERVTGYSREDFDAKWRNIVHPDDREIFRKRIERILNNETDKSEFRIIHANGEVKWLRAFTRPIYSSKEKRVVQAVGAIQDITSQKQSDERIEQLAFYDALTNLGNRRQWKIWADVALARAQVQHKSLAVMYIDLDRFKAINDTLGHDIGDALLIEVAKRLYTCLEGEDRLARLGGDEFAILMIETDENRAIQVAKRVLSQFDAPFIVRNNTIQARGSIGIALYPRDGENLGALQQHADIAMYRAKTKAERFQIYDPKIKTYVEEQVRLEAELGEAIENGGLTLYYQPILGLKEGNIVKAEVLTRWFHPRKGPIAPSTFIPLAEESGMITLLDRWVTRMGLIQAATWARQGIDVSLSINLSVLTLQDEDIVDYIRDILQRTGAPPDRIVFEVTESAAIRDPEATKRVLTLLRNLGIHVAIDDFGRGYTSLVFLKSLPIDSVKIDMMFVQGIAKGSRDEGVMQAILALGKGLDIVVVAEGVEDQMQLDWLAQNGCDQVQGYFIGRPMPIEQFEQSLQSTVVAKPRVIQRISQK